MSEQWGSEFLFMFVKVDHDHVEGINRLRATDVRDSTFSRNFKVHGVEMEAALLAMAIGHG